jgi:hypothetical protein
MFVSSLCIIAETVLPGAATSSRILTDGPKTVMSLAPEIILPGCFQQAQFAQRNGNSIKGKLLFCLCALFGLLTLITLASFIWHFSAAIANLILFIRCGAGISYTIILNISGHDGHAPDHSQTPSPYLPIVIQPLRVNIRKGQTDLQLLALIEQHATGDLERPRRKPVQEGRVEVQEVPREVVYPVVPGVSAEKVKQLIDAFLRGAKWRDMPGHYSQTIKPVREAWERLQTGAI